MTEWEAGGVWPSQSFDSDCCIGVVGLPRLDAVAILLHQLVVAEARV